MSYNYFNYLFYYFFFGCSCRDWVLNANFELTVEYLHVLFCVYLLLGYELFVVSIFFMFVVPALIFFIVMVFHKAPNILNLLFRSSSSNLD